jgi:hypothetical protein
MVYDHASRDSFDPSRTARAFGSDDPHCARGIATSTALLECVHRPDGRMGVAAAELVDAN